MVIKEKVKLSGYTTIGIGGTVSYFVEAKDTEDAENAIKFSAALNLPYFVLGGGSNLLINDAHLEMVIIKPKIKDISIQGTKVEAGAAVKLPKLVQLLAKQELSGLEELAEIPGEVGGAVVMNAGAYGREIGEVIETVEIYDGEKFIKLKRDELAFSYRSSGIKPGWIITKVTFNLKRGNIFRITKLIADIKRKRRQSQPVGEKTFGSVFKNPEGTSAGLLIEKAGLKGFRINGAEISRKHANFIINRGGATFKDVVALMELVQNRVKEQFGIYLQPEVMILKGV